MSAAERQPELREVWPAESAFDLTVAGDGDPPVPPSPAPMPITAPAVTAPATTAVAAMIPICFSMVLVSSVLIRHELRCGRQVRPAARFNIRSGGLRGD